MKVIIFANHHTNERVACAILFTQDLKGLQKHLNLTLGGSWVRVQDLKPYEAISFTASKEYHGFDNNPEDDYCGNILKLPNGRE